MIRCLFASMGEILDRRLMSVLGLFAWVSDVLLSLVAAKLSSSNARKRFIKTKSPNITCLWFVSFWLLECWGWGETFYYDVLTSMVK